MALVRRLIYFSLTSFCLAAIILIVKLFNNNHFIRGFIGDVIIIWLIYFFIKTFYNFHALKLATFTLVIAFTTEFIQYLHITTFFGFEQNTVTSLVFGTVFDPYDLIAYTIGAVSIYIIDSRLVKFRTLS